MTQHVMTAQSDTLHTDTARPETAGAAPGAEPINSLDTAGTGILALIGLGGLWMILAPFLVGYQARGGQWSTGTTNDVVTGAIVAILALAALITVIAGGLSALTRAARNRTGA